MLDSKRGREQDTKQKKRTRGGGNVKQDQDTEGCELGHKQNKL